MTHALNKLLPAKSRRQYQQVPLEIPLFAQSSSEDDDTLLYKAPSLNESNLQTFGVSMYDHSHDLDLPRISRLQDKSCRDKPGREKNCKNSKTLLCTILVVSCLLIALISAFAILVVGNWDHFSISSASTPTPSCIPKPLPDGSQLPCQMTYESTLLPVTAHPSPPPSSPFTASPSSTTTSEMETEISPHTSQMVLGTTTPRPPNHKTSETETNQSNEEEDPTSVDGPMTGTDDDHASVTSVGSHAMPSEEPEVRFDVKVITEPFESSCVTIPKPFPPSMSSVKSAILLPTPLPTMVTTLTNDDGTTSTDSPREETVLPAIELPTSAATKGAEEGNGAGDSLPTMMEDVDATQPMKTPSFVPTLQSEPLSWERKFMPGVSQTTPVVYDLDGDGMVERLVVESYIGECTSRVSALSGINGSTVWKQVVHFFAFAVRCIVDANGDGNVDCLVTGHGGGFLTLSGVDGHLIWVVDISVVSPMYNFYFPLLLPDFNGDGVDDLINIHGGDTNYKPEEHNRSPAYLVAVSGKTGQKLMDPILMPDGHESYNSPVLFSVNSVDQLVLFGSGGETVGGSLWGIQLESLRLRIASYLENPLVDLDYQISLNDTFHPCFLNPLEIQSSRPVMNTTKFDFQRTVSSERSGCPTWSKKKMAVWNDYGVCLYEFVRSASKGVLVPPVAVDLTEDGVKDLVVSIFDGRTVALDGRDLDHILWEVYYPDTESYSLPAPLFYTPDKIPDLLIRTNLGAWSFGYNLSSILVLDGRDGSVLWTYNSITSAMVSTISVVSLTHGRDALIFYVVGDDGGGGGVGEEGKSVRDTQRNGMRRKRRHEGMEERLEEDLWVSTPDDPVPDNLTLDNLLDYCEQSRTGMTISLYMVTREMVESGMQVLPLATYGPHLFFNPSGNHSNDSLRHQHVVEKRHGGKPEEEMEDLMSIRCEHILSPTDYTIGTPLLGDLNSDGRLDIVYDIVWASQRVPSQILVVATDLELLFEGAYGKGILDFNTFLPTAEQPWNQYMGRDGKCAFEPHPKS